MSRETAKQKSATGRFTQSMMTGARILVGADVPAYTLTYLSNTSSKRVGDYETIVIPTIQLGRDGGCAIRFQHSEYPTVSGTHAAIERQAENVVIIKHLSQSNPTLVNGRPINKEWYLNNGDVVQLSLEGPKLRYNTSATGTAKIGFTQKAKLVAEQAIKPYKTAISIIGLILVISTSTLTYFLRDTKIALEEALGRIELSEEELENTKRKAVEYEEQLKLEQEKMRQALVSIEKGKRKVSSLKTEFDKLKSSQNVGVGGNVPNAIGDEIKGQVYFLRVTKIQVELPSGEKGETDKGWTGTGFLLADGRFVTARHCIQGWRFIKSPDDPLYVLNIAENNGGRVVVDFEAQSSTGNVIEFQYDSRNVSGISIKDNSDKTLDAGGQNVIIAQPNASDWAVITNFSGGSQSSLIILPDFASSPKAQIPVHILGYSYGDNLQGRQIKPLYSSSMIAQDGLTNGLINLTDRNFGPGNSGGPVFVFDKTDEKYKIIGIVSAGVGAEIGIIVPISQIR
jgi:hypothetical protein